MRDIFQQQVGDGSLPHPNDPETFDRAKLPWEDFTAPQHRAALDRFRQLASWRREKMWPLAATPCLAAFGERHQVAAIVNWRFERGTLTVVYNASALPHDLPCRINGNPVYTGEYFVQGDVLRLGAWSAVAWNNV